MRPRSVNGVKLGYGAEIEFLFAGADHLLEANCETLFVPTDFENPFHYLRTDIMSKPQAIQAMEQFADALAFDLKSGFDEERGEDNPDYVAIAKNVARIPYPFFFATPAKRAFSLPDLDRG